MDINYSYIGRQIRSRRDAEGLSQAALADKANISPQYLCVVENGKKNISLKTLIRIAKALDTSVNVLLYGNTNLEPGERDAEIRKLLSGCTDYEKKIVLDVATAAKKAWR